MAVRSQWLFGKNFSIETSRAAPAEERKIGEKGGREGLNVVTNRR